MPEGRVKRCVARPSRAVGSCGSICASRIVLKLPLGGGPRVCFGDISEVCLDAGDREGGCVDLIELVAGIVAREGSNAGSDETHLERLGVVDHCGVTIGGSVDSIGAVGEVVVVDHKLVFVCMTEENSWERLSVSEFMTDCA